MSVDNDQYEKVRQALESLENLESQIAGARKNIEEFIKWNREKGETAVIVKNLAEKPGSA